MEYILDPHIIDVLETVIGFLTDLQASNPTPPHKHKDIYIVSTMLLCYAYVSSIFHKST